MTSKTILAIPLAAILIIGFGAAHAQGQPFQALWDAIADLQEQIDNIQAGEQGPPGDVGPPGPPGPPGGSQTLQIRTEVSQPLLIDTGLTGTIVTSCEDDEQVISGGHTSASNAFLNVFNSAPSNNNGWFISVKNPTENAHAIQGIAICAKLTP